MRRNFALQGKYTNIRDEKFSALQIHKISCIEGLSFSISNSCGCELQHCSSFILVSLVRIKTKSRKTDIWSGKFKKKIKRFQAESTNIIPTKASSFSRTFNFLLPSLCGMETGCQVVYMMPSRKKAGIQSMSGFQLHRLAYAFRLSGICLSISRLKQTASCWLGCWLCPYVNFYNKHWSTFFHAVNSYVHPILKAVCPQNMMRTVIKGMVLFPILFDRIYEFLPLWCLMVWALLRGAHLFVCLYSSCWSYLLQKNQWAAVQWTNGSDGVLCCWFSFSYM